jgi:hypothetical protein
VRHYEPDVGPTRVSNVPALHGKEVVLVGGEPMEACRLIGCRHAGDEEAWKTPVDGSAAPSRPTGWGKQQDAPLVVRRAIVLSSWN